MYLACHKTTSPGKSEILFPVYECWNPLTKVATTMTEVDKKRVLCRISMEVLQENFDFSMEDPLRAVADDRLRLRYKSKILIGNKAFQEDGSILIQSKDL